MDGSKNWYETYVAKPGQPVMIHPGDPLTQAKEELGEDEEILWMDENNANYFEGVDSDGYRFGGIASIILIGAVVVGVGMLMSARFAQQPLFPLIGGAVMTLGAIVALLRIMAQVQ